jgi:hypothetical protein
MFPELPPASFKEKKYMNKLFVGALCAVAASLASAAPAAAKPRQGAVVDKLYDEYVEEYWIWAFNQPEEVNPLLNNDPFCGESKDGKTVFLSGTILDGPQQRSCDVDHGQWLYLSVISSNYIAFKSDPPETKTYEAMQSFANCEGATATVTVDGKTFDVTSSYTYTPIFDFPVEEGGFLADLLAGEETDGSVVQGIHVLLPPLSKGQHTISWKGQGPACGVVDKDLTYTINVE